MRIAVDAHTLSRPLQGVRTYTEELFREVAQLDVELDLVMLEAKGARDPDLDIRAARANWSGGRLYRLLHGPAREMRRYDCVAYHASYWVPIFPPQRVFVTIHDILPHTHPQYFTRWDAFSRSRWFRYSATHATHVFTVSSYSKDAMVHEFGISPDKISITPCGVRLERYCATPPARIVTVRPCLYHHPYMVSVGRFDRRKNHETMIRAYGRLASDVADDLPNLIFVGSTGDKENHVRQLITRLGLDRRIVVLTGVGDEELPSIVRGAVCSISASFAEGFGLPNLEAMASGTPVISADNTAQREVVDGAGLLFRADDVDGLAAAMHRVVSDGELRAILRERGRLRVGQYSWKAAAETFVQDVLRYMP